MKEKEEEKENLEDVASPSGAGGADSGHSDISRSWEALNRQRGLLIDKNIAGILTAEESVRLDLMQAYTDLRMEQFERARTAEIALRRLWQATVRKDTLDHEADPEDREWSKRLIELTDAMAQARQVLNGAGGIPKSSEGENR